MCITLRLDNRTFLYRASVLALSNLGLQLLGFLYRIALSHLTGAEGLGVYRLVLSVYMVIYSACLSGITLACSRLSAAKLAEGHPEQLRALLHIAVGIFSIVFALCAALVAPFHEFIAHTLLGDGRTADALPIMLFCLLLTGFENIIKSLFMGIGRVQYAAISEVCEQILRLVIVVTLLSLYGGADYGRIAALILLGMTLSEIFSVTFLSFLYRKHIRPLGNGHPVRADSQLLHNTLDIALPLSFAAVISNIIGSANAVILPRRLVVAGYTESEAIGALGVISGMSGPLILLPIALIGALTAVLVPHISDAQSRGNPARVQALAQKALTAAGLIGVPATAALVPLAPSLARLFFSQALSLPYMMLLGIDAVLTYYQIVAACILNGVGEQRRAVIGAILGESAQLFLTWRLASNAALGIYGYILAMIFSALLVCVLHLYNIHVCIGLQFRFLRIFGIPLLCGTTVYFWVRVFYSFFLGVFGAQWCATLWAAGTALALYLALLRMLGISVWRYISHRLERPTFPTFWSHL